MFNTNYTKNLGLFSSLLNKKHIYIPKNDHYKTPAYIHPNPLNQPKPTKSTFKRKHYDPKFKLDRGRKVMKVDLPDFQKRATDIKKSTEMTPEERNKEMRELGVQPFRPWDERPLFFGCTAQVVEPYVPPEGDGKANFISKEGAKQSVEFVGKKGKSLIALRKIKQFEDDFSMKNFAETAKEIYINMHTALCDRDEKLLHTLATESVFPLLMHQTKMKTLRWNFYGSLEPEKVVLMRVENGLDEDDFFGQVTVRFHTQQSLAVYDRFGRLIYGSESVLRDVLEYIVFEKRLSNIYGQWRVHEKILPSWIKPKDYSLLSSRAN